jgi:hypothetical protein
MAGKHYNDTQRRQILALFHSRTESVDLFAQRYGCGYPHFPTSKHAKLSSSQQSKNFKFIRSGGVNLVPLPATNRWWFVVRAKVHKMSFVCIFPCIFRTK